MERRMSAKALFVGFLADVFGTYIGGGTAAIAAAIGLTLFHAGSAIQDEAFLASLALLLIGMAFGLAFSALGGYVAATIAQTEKLRHALGMGFLSVLASLVPIALSRRQEPTWSYVVGCLLVLPVALFGGYLGTARGKTKGLFGRVLLAASILTFLWTIALGWAAVLVARS